MSQSPIPRVLSTFRRRRVKALLMGGQACILYGGAEFSRDVDFAVAVSLGNLGRLRKALDDLRAEPVFFPALSPEHLLKGHACHFRCLASGLHRLRIDVMSVMRGVDSFQRLWSRRQVMNLPGVGRIAVLALTDLVRAKKTQRDKDWPMIRRMIEADVDRSPARVSLSRIRLWLDECRTPELLCGLVRRYPREAAQRAPHRPAVRSALKNDARAVEHALEVEERREREKDRRYWKPLRTELERWRLNRSKGAPSP